MKKVSVQVFTVLAAMILLLSGTVSARVGYLGPAATYTE